MPTDKNELRTQKAAFFWRWWDEAEHKSSPEKRLAFYDAMMRYIFRGDVPPDPLDMETPTGADYAAYDATHYFDVIDSLVERGEERARGGQPGNQNARKNESENESETNPKTNPKRIETNAERKGKRKNESLRMKNEEFNITSAEADVFRAGAREADAGIAENVASATPSVKTNPDVPTLEDVLRVCRNDDCANPGGKSIPAAFGRWFFGTMEGMGWQQTNGRRVTRRNFRPFLFTWWRRADESEWAGDGSAEGGGEPSDAMRKARSLAEKARRMREDILAGKPDAKGGAK